MALVDWLYAVSVLAASAAIGAAGWPETWRWMGRGLVAGVGLLTLGLSIGLAQVRYSWFALEQSALAMAQRADTHFLVASLLEGFAVAIAHLTLAAQGAFPGLPLGLGISLLSLVGYMLVKGVLLSVLALVSGEQGRAVITFQPPPPPRHWSGLWWMWGVLPLAALGLSLLPFGAERTTAVAYLIHGFWVGFWVLALEVPLWWSPSTLRSWPKLFPSLVHKS
ncbi:MAG: hypothetical protein ACFCBW_19160 [Candidatus Competibacterales bacterium]